MVKNVKGGNKAKGQARKTNNFNKAPSSSLRISQDNLELYAQVTKTLGNGMCHVLCILDGVTRLCHIRGKFRGRNKTNNIIKNGSWILVGLRSWENSSSLNNNNKMDKCDLLEVYSDYEKDRLKNQVKIDWSLFITNDNVISNTNEEDAFEFTDDKMEEYHEIIKQDMADTDRKVIDIVTSNNNEDDIDFDDI